VPGQERPLEPTDLLLIPIGIAVGTFGTLVGAGGGFLLVPILLLIYPDRSPETITAMSLLVVFFNATSGSLAYARFGRIDYYSGAWFAVGTLPGAVIGAVLVGYIPRRTFDAVFAGTLLAIGLYLIFRRGTQAIRDPLTGRGVVRREMPDRHGHRFVYSYRLWQGVALAAAIGFVSSLLGIGGGVVHVPVMVTVLHFPVHIAAATSQFVLAFMAGEGTAVHVFEGTLHWDRALVESLLLAAGAIPGAQAGAMLSRRVAGPGIMRALAVALVVVGVRLAVKAAVP
jgi:uncharacterized membrane protein YfcA